MPQNTKQMVPWTIDAAGVDVANLRSPYCRDDLRVFLDSKVGSLHRILVAPKGYGKTLYLKYKARKIRELYKDQVPIFPSSVKPQDIEFLKLSLDWREMLHDVGRLSVNDWSLLWQLVLISKGLQMLDAVSGLDEYLKTLLRAKSEPVADILSAVIRDRDQFGLNTTQRLRQVRLAFNDSGRDVVLFIDNTDEMFVGLDRVLQLREVHQKGQRTPIRVSEESAIQNDSDLSMEVAKSNPAMWKAAQVGLLLAVREIERSVQLLSVYTTLRAEAVNTADHEDALQAKTYIVPITYNEEDLAEIFAWHVDMMSKSDLVDPQATHPAERLMGVEPIEHRYVHDSDGLLYEKPFDLVLRHTTLSPRDLIVIGGHIAKLSRTERAGPLRAVRIRQAIDKAVAELLVYFRQNAIPKWMDDWEYELKKFSTPVVDEATARTKLGPSKDRFYSYGLLGVAQSSGKAGQYHQAFLTQWDGVYAAQELPLPKADYYFLHPWLHDWAKRFNPDFTADASNIVGNGCTYHAPGLLQLMIGADLNGKPAIWSDGEMDSPVGNSRDCPMAAVVFLSLLLACRKHHTLKVTRALLEEGRDDFNRLFPSFRESDSMRPFDDGEHRSHLRKHVLKAFPTLRPKVERLRGNLKVFSGAGNDPEPYIELDFVDIDHLTIGGASGGVALSAHSF